MRVLSIAVVLLLALVATAQAGHLFSDTAGHTTLEQVITGSDPSTAYSNLHTEPGTGNHVVRDGSAEGIPAAHRPAGPRDPPPSLAYFGQMSDFQLADEESPARVEFLDGEPSGFGEAAWRPQEALHPFVDRLVDPPDEPVRRPSPVAAGRRLARAHGLRAADRRPARQHAAKRGRVGARPARGRPAQPQQRQSPTRRLRPGRHPSCAAYAPTPDHLAEAAALHRRAGLHDYHGQPDTLLLRPQRRAGLLGGEGLAELPGADGPRGAVRVPAGGPQRPELCRQRQPRRPGAGQRGRQRRLRGHRDRLLQGARSAARAPTSRRRTASTPTGCCHRPAGCSCRPTRSGASSTRRSSSRSTTANGMDDGARLRLRRPGREHGLERRGRRTTPGTRRRRRASASSRSTRSPRAASSAVLANGNIDDPQFQWLVQRAEPATAAATSWSCCSATTRSAASTPSRRTRPPGPARRARTRTATRPSTTPARAATPTRAPRADPPRRAEPAAARRHARDALRAARPLSRT